MALLTKLSKAWHRQFADAPGAGIPVHWTRRDPAAWLAAELPRSAFTPPANPWSERIEELARETDALGKQPLWEGYAGHNRGGATRSSDEVRTAASMGALYTFLVRQRRPEVVVEFGTAFGVSGMYFLGGLEANRHGRLLTFEPNSVWAGIAEKNLRQIGGRFRLTVGTFEAHIDEVLPPEQRIDMAFIDAIHTRSFVLPQLELVLRHAAPGALVILDDIDFSEDMRDCWLEVAQDRRFRASVALGERVGIVERA